MDPSLPHRFTRLLPDGTATPHERAVAAEVPVAVEVNGLGYAVMMATPGDLDDFALGFALAERLVTTPAELVTVTTHQVPTGGVILRLTLAAERAAMVADRVRHRIAESSCGLCGLENLEQVLRPLPQVTTRSAAAPAALFRAVAALRAHQPLNRLTGAVHAAALCGADGAIRLVREDVGRHNAFDKLIGAMACGRLGWDGGFALLSARCSFELVEKAVLADCPLLVTISLATGLALDRAAAAGLRLVTLARQDAMLATTPPSL